MQLDVGDHESPAEMETVKKILETVNANVTRQLLEASVQRVKNAGHNPADRERCYRGGSSNSSNKSRDGWAAKATAGSAIPNPDLR